MTTNTKKIVERVPFRAVRVKTDLELLVDQLEAKGFRLSIDRIRGSGEWHASAWEGPHDGCASVGGGWSNWSNWSAGRFDRRGRKGVGTTMEDAVRDLLAKLGEHKARC